MIDDPVEFLRKCINYYSPSGKEEKYAKFLADFLKEHNFKVKFDKVGNLIAEKGYGRPVILFSSHMDTIPGELPIIEKEGKIYGRGAVDCKSSLAAMVYAIAHYDFSQENIGKIIFAGIVREETEVIGIKELTKSDIKPDYAIFGEPTTINQICIGYKGRLCIGYKISTEMGHIACSWLYSNAIEIGLKIWEIVKINCQELSEKYCIKSSNTKYFDQIIPNLTVISGGDLTNCNPYKCILNIDIRYPPSITSEKILNKIREKIIKYKETELNGEEREIQIEEEILSQVEGFEIKKDDTIIGALRWAIFKTINKKPILIKKTGTTFINTIGIHYQIPSITYGSGNPRLEHTDKEFVEIEEYLDSIKIYKKFLNKLYEIHNKKKA
ncbi:MAG: M20/M25/M40 family metallo-hydrolase [Candidatus Lokiarchaeota archaeon]|nr:M20/M25/M40 family metallo-hydrolase [Candidatus Lokiarchaeota archaeon]